MTLRFPYKLLPTKSPVISLDGRLVRPRPLIVVTLIGPAESTTQTAHLDPGSDDCVFPDHLAAKLGIDLDSAPVGEAVGVGQEAVSLRYARVTLRVASGDELLEWAAWVAFAALPLKRPLLGFARILAVLHRDISWGYGRSGIVGQRTISGSLTLTANAQRTWLRALPKELFI